MLRVNKKMEYGIIALLHIAEKQDKTASVREISEAKHIPEPLLSKVMQRLKAKNMVQAVYGNQGGYRLNRDLSTITLLDINDIFAGPIQLAECLNLEKSCPAHSSCTIATPMAVLNQKLISLFQSTSVESLQSLGKEKA